MPKKWGVNFNARGEIVFPRKKIARNFRRILLDYHARWDDSFEIAFWRRKGEVICEVQDSEGPHDLERVAKIKARITEMQNNPLRLIRLKRKALGLTIAVAAERAGMPRSHWNMIELGQRKLTLCSVQKIAEVLDLPTAKLIDS